MKLLVAWRVEWRRVVSKGWDAFGSTVLMPFMLSDWSSTGTRGSSLIYHLIHPNSHPDVLWPLATHTHTQTHTQRRTHTHTRAHKHTSTHADSLPGCTGHFLMQPESITHPTGWQTHTHTNAHTHTLLNWITGTPLFLPSPSSDHGIDKSTYTGTIAGRCMCDLSGIRIAPPVSLLITAGILCRNITFLLELVFFPIF